MAQFVSVNGDLTDPLTFLPQDLLDRQIFLLHQVNTLGVMGAGVALTFAQKYPQMFEDYYEYCQTAPVLIGTTLIYQTDNIYIVNLFGQHLTHKVRDTNYEAIYSALSLFSQTVSHFPDAIIALPLNMSSGLAGGNWNIISTMVKELFRDLPNTIYIVQYEQGA